MLTGTLQPTIISFWFSLSSMMPVLMKFIIAILMTMVTTVIALLLHTLYRLNKEYFDVHEYPDYSDVVDNILDAHNPELVQTIYEVQALEAPPAPKDYDLLKPFFTWAPADTIKRTLSVTTQYARGRVSDNLRQHWKSRFPACNVRRRNEAVATDTVFSDTPAVFSGGIKAV
jgi:hypothetical protein